MAIDLKRLQLENEDLKTNYIALGHKLTVLDDHKMDALRYKGLFEESEEERAKLQQQIRDDNARHQAEKRKWTELQEQLIADN